MNYSESEGLYPSYRLGFTKKIVPLIQQCVSFKIKGIPGVGKSKYLRYFTESETLKNNYFTSPKVKFYYVDLNLVFSNNTDQLVELICEKIDAEGSTIKCFENKLKSIMETYDLVYFVFDHSEKFLIFDESAIRYIRAVRDMFKQNLGIIIAYESEANFSADSLKHFDDFVSLELILEPFTKDEAIENIRYFAKLQNIQLQDTDYEILAKATKGYAKHIKHLLNEILMGKTSLEAIESTKESSVIRDTGSMDTLLNKAMKHLTKSEFMVFNELYNGNGNVVTRDQLATLLNPETEGEGVSNESIDQIVSRVRKALTEANIDIEIKTKRGIGYYI